MTLQTNGLVLPSIERSGLYWRNIPNLLGNAVEMLGRDQLEIKGYKFALLSEQQKEADTNL